MPRRRANSAYWVIGILLGFAVLLAFLSSRSGPEKESPRARYSDATPLGGRGLALVLERLGYTTKKQTQQLTAMPPDATVWMLLDPETRFTRGEAKLLLDWVKKGHTLIWAVRSESISEGVLSQGQGYGTGVDQLHESLVVQLNEQPYNTPTGAFLPTLTPLGFGATSVYRTGVKTAQGSPSWMQIDREHLEIAGSISGIQLARMDLGKGRVFLLPDAMLCTNYAICTADNATLVTNLVRAHDLSGTVYFDERQVQDSSPSAFHPTLLYYLWRPPLRWAWLQLIVAGLLFWGMAGRRLGAPVPLPQRGPVTRASQYASAMGSMFHKVNRPKAAGRIVGDDFRRQLAKRLGMSPNDPDAALARRAHEVAGLPVDLVDRLLLHSKSPSESESAALRDAQEMELVLRHLNIH